MNLPSTEAVAAFVLAASRSASRAAEISAQVSEVRGRASESLSHVATISTLVKHGQFSETSGDDWLRVAHLHALAIMCRGVLHSSEQNAANDSATARANAEQVAALETDYRRAVSNRDEAAALSIATEIVRHACLATNNELSASDELGRATNAADRFATKFSEVFPNR